MEKYKVFLTTGQVFFTPEANLPTVQRIYEGKILRIEPPEEKKTLQSLPAQPQKNESVAVGEVNADEAKEVTEQPKPEPPKPQAPIQPKLPEHEDAKKKADYTKSNSRLKSVNKRKPTKTK